MLHPSKTPLEELGERVISKEDLLAIGVEPNGQAVCDIAAGRPKMCPVMTILSCSRGQISGCAIKMRKALAEQAQRSEGQQG